MEGVGRETEKKEEQWGRRKTIILALALLVIWR